MDVAELLARQPVAPLAVPIVRLRADTECSVALEALQAAHINAAPVYLRVDAADAEQYTARGVPVIRADDAHRSEAVDVLMGFADVADIVSTMLRRGMAATLESVIDDLGVHSLLCVPVTANFGHAAAVMAKTGAYRVAVVDPAADNAVVGVVTQSQVLRLVQRSMDALGSLAGVQVGVLFPTSTHSKPLHVPYNAAARLCLEVSRDSRLRCDRFRSEGCRIRIHAAGVRWSERRCGAFAALKGL
jgi:hypothetical protein